MANETPRITKEKMDAEVLTREKFKPLFDDIKEQIKTSARGTENVLGGKIDKLDERVTSVEARLEATQHFVEKMEKRLDEKIEGVRAELSEKMDKVISKVDSHEIRLSTVEEKIETHLTAHP